MYFNFIYDEVPPIKAKIYELGSWVNLHPRVLARGDELHLLGSLFTYPRALFPIGQDVPGPNYVRGCPVLGRKLVATTSLGPLGAPISN